MSTPGRKTRMDKRARRAPSPAFSLVESVVSGSVILFAVAVLAPSGRAARERDHVAVCLANLRAIGQASLIYAGEDPNEIFIPVPDTNVLPDASGAIEWGGKAGIGQSADPNNPARSIFGTASYRGPAHRRQRSAYLRRHHQRSDRHHRLVAAGAWFPGLEILARDLLCGLGLDGPQPHLLELVGCSRLLAP